MFCKLYKAALGSAVLTLAFTLSTLTSRADTVLLSDNFNSEVGALNQTTFANFTVNRGSVDVIGGNGGQVVDLDGSTSASGLFVSKTAFNLTPGTYTLQFDLGNGPNNALTVSLGSAYSEIFTQPTVGFTTFTRTINVLSPTMANLSFDQSGDDNVGYYLDNVSLTLKDGGNPNPNPVPEPTTMLLLGTGLAGLGGMIKRRRQGNKD
jgi:hypothetical protein